MVGSNAAPVGSGVGVDVAVAVGVMLLSVLLSALSLLLVLIFSLCRRCCRDGIRVAVCSTLSTPTPVDPEHRTFNITLNKHERMALLNRLETRLTPYFDRLPKRERPDIGAGYAMAVAAAVAAVVFGIVSALISAVGTAALFFSVGDYTNPLVVAGIGLAAGLSWLPLAGLSLVLVVPGGFVGGFAVWRFVPESLRVGGLVGGLLSTLVGYAFSWGLLLPFAAGYGIIVERIPAGPSLATAAGSVLEFGLLLGFISVSTSWAAVPAGVLTGYLYERSLH
jgi:hypothetical protein